MPIIFKNNKKKYVVVGGWEQFDFTTTEIPSQPKIGWLHLCSICLTITSNYIKFPTKKKEYEIYMCKKCSREEWLESQENFIYHMLKRHK